MSNTVDCDVLHARVLCPRAMLQPNCVAATLAAAAIQFPMAHPCVRSVIPGSFHPRQVEENLAYFREEIPSALWADLKVEGLIRKDAPTPSIV